MTKPTKAATHAVEINPFITLRKILLEKEFDDITTTELDIAIEDHGIYAMGRNVRYEKHDYKSEAGERALVLLDLFMKYKQNMENNIFDKELISPLEEYTEKSDPSEYELYGWMKSDLPSTLFIAPNQTEANTADQNLTKTKEEFENEAIRERAEKQKILNESRHATSRAAKALVLAEWDKDKSKYISAAKAGKHFSEWLVSQNDKYEYEATTVTGWIRDHAKVIGVKWR